jgi:hypothetical protein
MITRETIAQIPEVSHVLPPSIVSLPSGRHAVYPGGDWYPIADDVTLEDVQSRWSRWSPSGKKEEASPNEWQVLGSKGTPYLVSFGNGQWSCTCAGFGFRRKCSHIDKIKAQL